MANARKHPLPLIDALMSELAYCPDTGKISRIKWRGVQCEPFDVGVTHHSGYVVVKAFRQMLLAHRVAWALNNGEWPTLFVDHINGDKSDNRAMNLRLVNETQSARNASAFGSSGLRGVTLDKVSKKWIARASIDTEYKYLGTFDTKELAREAYLKATLPVYGEFVRLTESERLAA
jgi:hypothetical protein